MSAPTARTAMPAAARKRLRYAGAVALLVGASGLAACSADVLLWGADGAAVIRATDRLIEEASDGDASALVCPDMVLDLGDPGQWRGLSSEEPERFTPDYWPEQADRDPEWSINLSLPPDRVADGTVFPGDVFYREDDGALCVVDVVWSIVEYG